MSIYSLVFFSDGISLYQVHLIYRRLIRHCRQPDLSRTDQIADVAVRIGTEHSLAICWVEYRVWT